MFTGDKEIRKLFIFSEKQSEGLRLSDEAPDEPPNPAEVDIQLPMLIWHLLSLSHNGKHKSIPGWFLMYLLHRSYWSEILKHNW